jgi:hypothetical protein
MAQAHERQIRLANPTDEVMVMSADRSHLLKKNWTSAELRKLPAEERNAILEAAAALAE